MISTRRRTKIVCTIGPSCNTEKGIENLLLHGMNVARLNFSHGTHEDHARVIKIIRKVAKANKYSIPILMDLQGPKIRVGTMKNGGQVLKTGSLVTITGEEIEGSPLKIPIDYSGLVTEAEMRNIPL